MRFVIAAAVLLALPAVLPPADAAPACNFPLAAQGSPVDGGRVPPRTGWGLRARPLGSNALFLFSSTAPAAWSLVDAWSGSVLFEAVSMGATFEGPVVFPTDRICVNVRNIDPAGDVGFAYAWV